MTEQTLTALKESIAHWKRLETGTRLPPESVGSNDCALCGLFFRVDCQGCPVRNRTSQPLCRNSPYLKADSAWHVWGPGSMQFTKAAKEEREFLESLLPINEQENSQRA